jgi:phenylpyruvate tautomerase PptA (4-oxalocrotonate tautomerase family)
MTSIIVCCGDDTHHRQEATQMPMIELTYPKGSIRKDARAELLDELATKLLAAEKAPDTEFFRSITWVYAHEVDPDDLAVGGRPGGEPRFRVQVTVPEGALSDRRKGILVEAANQAVLRAAGLSDSEGLRVWTLIRDVPEGNWGAAGQQVRYQQLVEAAAAEREGSGAAAAVAAGSG